MNECLTNTAYRVQPCRGATSRADTLPRAAAPIHTAIGSQDLWHDPISRGTCVSLSLSLSLDPSIDRDTRVQEIELAWIHYAVTGDTAYLSLITALLPLIQNEPFRAVGEVRRVYSLVSHVPCIAHSRARLFVRTLASL